jgi:hypothetical protein
MRLFSKDKIEELKILIVNLIKTFDKKILEI